MKRTSNSMEHISDEKVDEADTSTLEKQSTLLRICKSRQFRIIAPIAAACLIIAFAVFALPINQDTHSNPDDRIDDNLATSGITQENRMISVSYDYLTFEDALVEFATYVVVAEYVGYNLFGRELIEFEFAVSERVLGNAADRIFIYEYRDVNNSVMMHDRTFTFNPDDLMFNTGTKYLLPLMRITSPYANTHDDGFRFIRNIFVNLNNPPNSIMYSEPLSQHSTDFDFDGANVTREEIISYVRELTKDNSPARGFIRSEVMEDIISGSPYVLVVEINEPFRLSEAQPSTDWMATDIYYVTVVQALKGDIDVGDELRMIFFADTVFTGDRHIVAVEQREEGGFYRFTSRNSLFHMDQLDEIMLLIDPTYEASSDFEAEAESELEMYESDEPEDGYGEDENEHEEPEDVGEELDEPEGDGDEE